MEFDDRVLAHLQIVIGLKFRRGESFHFSWRDDRDLGTGRMTIWLHPAMPLSFKYYGSRPPAVNIAWVRALEVTANTNAGLRIVAEASSGTSSGRQE